MPSSPGYKRDYKKEAEYESTPQQKKNRAARNKVRREDLAKGLVSKGQDVDHKKMLSQGGSTEASNTRVVSTSTNRSRNGHHKGETQKRKS